MGDTAVWSTQVLVLRAGIYEVVALGFAYPTETQRADLGVLAAGLVNSAASQEYIDGRERDLVGALGAVGVAWGSGHQHAVEADFNRLFSGPMECPPHETAYEPDIFRRQRALADIVGFYRAFGFDLGEETRWQADHIGVELEFCSILLQRQAHAVANGWTEQAEICDEALRSFLTDHLGRWYRSLAALLRTTGSVGAYVELAELTERWVSAELRSLDLRPEPLAERPRSFDEDQPPSCGANDATGVITTPVAGP